MGKEGFCRHLIIAPEGRTPPILCHETGLQPSSVGKDGVPYFEKKCPLMDQEKMNRHCQPIIRQTQAPDVT